MINFVSLDLTACFTLSIEKIFILNIPTNRSIFLFKINCFQLKIYKKYPILKLGLAKLNFYTLAIFVMI